MVSKVISDKSKSVFLLSSETTYKYGLYNDLVNKGVKLITPHKEMQKEIMEIVLSVMGGSDYRVPKSNVINTIFTMHMQRKIDSVILGCTELPIAIHADDASVRIYDSLEILADATLKFARNN